MSDLSYLQAVTIGLLQGVTELFPVSSLGHSVLVPALIGGSWQHLVTDESAKDSPYLAFIVGLHVATAIALLTFFWRDWVRIVRGVVLSLVRRDLADPYARLGWLIVLATIPVGLVGLLFEHALRVVFAKPLAAAIFLTVNGVLLYSGERLRRRSPRRAGEPRLAGAVPARSPAGAGATAATTSAAAATDLDAPHPAAANPEAGGINADDAATEAADNELVHRLTVSTALIVGTTQILALFAGISRSGVTMVAGLLRGLDHELAVRFAFLLATPVIFAAGVLKLGDFFGPLGNGIRGQVVLGSVVSGVAAYLSTRFLTRYFETRTLTPFAIYCGIFGGICVIRFAAF